MKYEKCGYVISVRINKDNIIRAIINKADVEGFFDFSLELTNNDEQIYVSLNGDSLYRMMADVSSINSAVTQYISNEYRAGNFNNSITKYKYMLSLIDGGKQDV